MATILDVVDNCDVLWFHKQLWCDIGVANNCGIAAFFIASFVTVIAVYFLIKIGYGFAIWIFATTFFATAT